MFSLFDENKKPKKEVFAADFRDRIVHHLLINRIIDRLEKNYWISDSYSCRVGKGTLFGAKRLKEQLNLASNNGEKENLFIMKLDLKNCFNTFNKNMIYNIFNKFLDVFPDKNNEYNKWLIHKILYHKPQKEGNYIKICSEKEFKCLPLKKSLFTCDDIHGLAIGNLTSQVFANTFLTLLDLFIKDTLNIEFYGRYVDDFYIIHEDKKYLLKVYNEIKKFLISLDLNVNPYKFYLQHYKKGVKFIGYFVYFDRIYRANRTKYKFFRFVYGINKYIYNAYILKNKKLELYKAEKISQRWNSYSGIFKWVKGKKNIFANVINRNKYFVEIMNKYFYFDSEFMLKYKIETKNIIKNFYLNGDIDHSYEDITYK